MTSGAVVHLQHNLRNAPVAAAEALGVHEGPEGLRPLLVGFVQEPIQHLLLQKAAFVLLCHPEIPGKVKRISVFPENISAKGVDGGDFG